MQQNVIRAELRSLHSPDASDLTTFQPDGPFGIFIQALVGPAGQKGQESFDMMVCTPDWFAANMKEGLSSGRHHLFVKAYDHQEIWDFLAEYCASCHGASWREVGEKVGRVGKWEFEDYVPHQAPSSTHH